MKTLHYVHMLKNKAQTMGETLLIFLCKEYNNKFPCILSYAVLKCFLIESYELNPNQTTSRNFSSFLLLN